MIQVESTSIAKPGRPVNEDLAITFGNFLAVLDGASVPKELTRCCTRGSRWYVERLAAGLLEAVAGEFGRKALTEILREAIAKVTREHLAECSGSGVGPSATVALSRFHEDFVDYLVLGDCTVVARGASRIQSATDGRLAAIAPEVRARIRDRLANGGTYEHPDHRRDVGALVQEQLRARNVPNGYWIAADDPEAAEAALVGSWPLSDSYEVALLTDGAARAVQLFGFVTTWEQLLDNLNGKGTYSLLRKVREMELNDTDGQDFPRTSGSDDATAVYSCEPRPNDGSPGNR